MLSQQRRAPPAAPQSPPNPSSLLVPPPAVRPAQAEAAYTIPLPSRPATAARAVSALTVQKIGRVISAHGSAAQVELLAGPTPPRAGIGAMTKICTRTAEVIAVISALSIKPSDQVKQVLLDLVLVGELRDEGKGIRFHRGVAHFACIGDETFLAGGEDITRVYVQAELATLNVGTIYQDPSIPARPLADDLLSKHFVIGGTTGSGKSCALTCILRQALQDYCYAYVVALDLHGEYHGAFGQQAEVIGARNLHLPF